MPGDPAAVMLGEETTLAELESLRDELGLERPLIVQYTDWAAGVVRGDLGESYINGFSVFGEITRRLVPTAQLAVASTLFALVLAVPASVLAAWRPRSFGRVVDAIFSAALAVPAFWVGILLILFVAVNLGWLPVVSSYVPVWEDPFQALRNLALPTLSLGLFTAGLFGRFIRASLEESLQADYMVAARAKGMSDLRVLATHGLRNSLIPLITVVGLRAGSIFGGAIVIEVVFNYPGMGRLLIQAVTSRDLLLIQGVLMYVLVTFVVVSFLADSTYYIADPRVRKESRRRSNRGRDPSDREVEKHAV